MISIDAVRGLSLRNCGGARGSCSLFVATGSEIYAEATRAVAQSLGMVAFEEA